MYSHVFTKTPKTAFNTRRSLRTFDLPFRRPV